MESVERVLEKAMVSLYLERGLVSLESLIGPIVAGIKID